MSRPDSESLDEILARLSLAIGTIMEDSVDTAIMRLPNTRGGRLDHFEKLGRAGRDIAALAAAAVALLRKG